MKRIFLTAIAIAASSFLFSLSLQAQIRGITESKKATNVKALQFPAENFAGNVNVGIGEAITSLTNSGGLFERMNAGTISGNVIVNITSDLTAERGTIPLYQQVETGVGGYTILIQPSGGPRLISGRGDGFRLIGLEGANRITLSGLPFGGKSLTIRNTAPFYLGGATIRLGGSNNSIISCVLEGGTEFDAHGVIMMAGTNVNNSIIGNTIRGRADATHGPANLIVMYGGRNTLIANNELSNYGKITGGTGMRILDVEDITISGNTISQTGPLAGGLTSILLTNSSGTNKISRNTIRDHCTYQFRGMQLGENDGTVSVSGNHIYNINNTSCDSSNGHEFFGITIYGDKLASVVRLSNNMVSFGNNILDSS